MKTYKIGYMKTETNDEGKQLDKYKEVDIEADKIDIDKMENLVLLKK